jgi:hypothetical protein
MTLCKAAARRSQLVRLHREIPRIKRRSVKNKSLIRRQESTKLRSMPRRSSKERVRSTFPLIRSSAQVQIGTSAKRRVNTMPPI